MSIAVCLREAAASLAGVSDTPRLDAELLMARALEVSRSDLLLRHMNDPMPDTFAALLARRERHEPVAYILGRQEFFGLEFHVDRSVLIPRPDSEVLVEKALECCPDAKAVLDCGTGSGALLLAVLASFPQARGVGIDSSHDALRVARNNARALNLSDRVRMERADWNEPGWSENLDGPFDLVLANPPYVEADAELASSVRDYEPAEALFAGPEGLDAYRSLIPQLPGLLGRDGVAMVEIGASQARAVSAIAEAVGLSARLHKDLAGRARALEIMQRR